MKTKANKLKINVENTEITVMRNDSEDYVSLSDLANYTNKVEPSQIIRNWLRTDAAISFVGLWKKINNPNFNSIEFDRIKTKTDENSFTMSLS